MGVVRGRVGGVRGRVGVVRGRVGVVRSGIGVVRVRVRVRAKIRFHTCATSAGCELKLVSTALA